MKRDLANQHRLASKVHFDKSHYHADTNQADIIFAAQPGPIVKVRVQGAKLSWLPFLRGRQMKKLIPIFSEGTVDADLVEEGRRNLIDFFQSKGYFDVKVTTNFQKQPSNIDMVYNVNRGRRHRVETVGSVGACTGTGWARSAVGPAKVTVTLLPRLAAMGSGVVQQGKSPMRRR